MQAPASAGGTARMGRAPSAAAAQGRQPACSRCCWVETRVVYTPRRQKAPKLPQKADGVPKNNGEGRKQAARWNGRPFLLLWISLQCGIIFVENSLPPHALR